MESHDRRGLDERCHADGCLQMPRPGRAVQTVGAAVGNAGKAAGQAASAAVKAAVPMGRVGQGKTINVVGKAMG
jgi:hypothetical protein